MSQHQLSERKTRVSNMSIIVPIRGAEEEEEVIEVTVMVTEEARDMATLTPAAAGDEEGCLTRGTAEEEAATATVRLTIEMWSRTMLRRRLLPPYRT